LVRVIDLPLKPISNPLADPSILALARDRGAFMNNKIEWELNEKESESHRNFVQFI
jgi:hypothetical protein